MNIFLITLLMFGSMLLFAFLGFPIAWTLGGVAVVVAYFLWGPQSLPIMAYNVFSQWSNVILMVVPLFFLLATLLQHSGLADELYEMMHRWMGGLKGGLAIGTTIACTIFAAISGVGASIIVAMAIIAIPSMLKRGYDKDMVLGTITASGTLGMLIPPSTVMVFYAFVTGVSIAKLWFAGFLPGLLCSALYMIYIAARCLHNPKLGPVLPPEERATWGEKFVSLRAVIAPLALVALILVSIYTGIATPTEAGVVGCLGMFVIIALRRGLTWSLVKNSLSSTFTLTAMVFWLLLAATVFTNVYVNLGARRLIEQAVLGWEVSPFLVVVITMLVLFVLGMVMDTSAIVLICGPIFAPIIEALGFDPIWYGIIFIMNMQIALCSPPYGLSLFMLRTVTPPGITIRDIYRSIWPFVGLQVVGLAIVMFLPQIALWLPNMMMGSK